MPSNSDTIKHNEMKSNETSHLIKMANQIAINCPLDEEEQVAQFVASHIDRFWAPRMKNLLKEMDEQNQDLLSSPVKKALTGSYLSATG